MAYDRKTNKEGWERKIILQYGFGEIIDSIEDGDKKYNIHIVKFIKEWKHAGEIQRELGFFRPVILDVCKNKKLTSYGFYWRYKTSEEIPEQLTAKKIIRTNKIITNKILNNKHQ